MSLTQRIDIHEKDGLDAGRSLLEEEIDTLTST